MGGLDSAEVCDLVGLFLLSELENLKLNGRVQEFELRSQKYLQEF